MRGTPGEVEGGYQRGAASSEGMLLCLGHEGTVG